MWDDVRSQGADYAGASSARKGELMADDGNISSFHRTKWSELGDQLDPEFRRPDTVPRQCFTSTFADCQAFSWQGQIRPQQGFVAPTPRNQDG